MEPEIVELAEFLRKMGARIQGDGTPVISVEGRDTLYAAEYIVPSDRIVAGTYLLGTVLTGGETRLLNVQVNHLGTLPELLEELGANVETDPGNHWISVNMNRSVRPVSYLTTAPFPGFPTDLQSVLMAVLGKSTGFSFLEEKIFEARFQVVPELQKMGANIQAGGAFALIEGVKTFYGADLEARELRGGAALVMAALAAEGVSSVSGMEFVQRGYEDLCGDLKNLGDVVNYS